MPKQTKANKALKETRVNRVFEYLVSGWTRYQMLQYVANEKNKDYPLFKDVSTRQFDNYIADANALFAAEAEFHRAREYGKQKARLEKVIVEAFKASDLASITRAVRELNAMLGLYPDPKPQTVRIEGISDDQLKMLVDMAKSKNKDVGAIITAAMQIMSEYVN